jgi:hypothetical protein
MVRPAIPVEHHARLCHGVEDGPMHPGIALWAHIYYQQQREKGTSHRAAVRALAFTWIRVHFRCWQHRTPYDESVYLNALQHRGAPLIRTLVHGS